MRLCGRSFLKHEETQRGFTGESDSFLSQKAKPNTLTIMVVKMPMMIRSRSSRVNGISFPSAWMNRGRNKSRRPMNDLFPSRAFVTVLCAPLWLFLFLPRRETKGFPKGEEGGSSLLFCFYRFRFYTGGMVALIFCKKKEIVLSL